MPLVSPEALKMPGVTIGGEGGQWPRAAMAVASTDPNFLLLPIDVGGLYRSVDGGKTWRLSMAGWNARGANYFAIDPRDAYRVLGIGGNGADWSPIWGQSPDGMYLSTDKGVSWKQTLAIPSGKAGRVVIDPSSFDKAKGYCSIAYFSTPGRGLFRTSDGGETWKGINRIAALETVNDYSPARVAVHPSDGTVYLAGKTGFFRSSDHGETFTRTLAKNDFTGLNVVAAQPDSVWTSNVEGLFVSGDSGLTFHQLPAKGISRDSDAALQDITVSPADPKRMLLWAASANYRWLRYVSEDGGQSFVPIQLESGLQTRAELAPVGGEIRSNALIPGGPAFLPFNTRNGYFAWHPTDPNVVWGIGGDWVTKSQDGGKTFLWSNNGFNGVMLGSSFNFSVSDPDKVFLGFQDNNGAFTLDGGKSWNYRDVSGKGWGGHDYGAGQSGADVIWCGDADDWGKPRRTRLSRDGGNTWDFAKDPAGQICEWKGSDISYTDPRNPAVLFASNWRSSDKGLTWAKMQNCEGVFSHAPDGRLFGKNGNTLVQSNDSGASWTNLTEVDGGFADVAFDFKRERWYFASQDQIKAWEKGEWTNLKIPADEYGHTKCVTVAVDPGQTDIVYGGGPANLYASHATVYRSTDAGATFENLSAGDGPHEVQWVRVHPLTGDAWVNGQCYGMWRISRPTKLGPADLARSDASRARPVPDGETPPPPAVDGKPQISKVIRDFGPSGFDYTFGPQWKNGENVKGTEDSLRFDTNEAGGGGMVLSGMNLVPFGEDHLAIRARLLPGNGATRIGAKVISEGLEAREVSFDLSLLSEDHWTLLFVPLGDGVFSKVAQIQLQGTNFGGGEPLRLDVDKIGTAKLLPGAPLAVEDGAAADPKLPKVYAVLPSAPDPDITCTIRDFGPAGVDYFFGKDWSSENVKPVAGALQFDTTENGGAGLVANGMDVAPSGQTHLALRARALPGNAASTIQINLMRDGGKAEVTFDLTKLKEDEWITLREPLGEGKWNKVNQVQVQGSHWNTDAPALKIQIDQIGTTSLDSAANESARMALANNPLAGPPTKAKPSAAGWGFYPDYPQAWMARHRSFLERTARGREKKDIRVIFFGDSITQGWNDTGKAVWDAHYEALGSVDYGIGGDSTRQILWRLENGEVDGLNPALIVLMIGTNNLYGDQNAGSDEEVAQGIAAVVETLRKKLPDSKVLLLGVLPRQNEWFSSRVQSINARAAKLDDGKNVRFLDMGAKFESTPGKGDIHADLYNQDHLHLAPKGYEVWVGAMAPMFESLLK